MLQESVPAMRAPGGPQLPGTGLLAVISVGMFARLNRPIIITTHQTNECPTYRNLNVQILVPADVISNAKTPPPTALNPAPYDSVL